MTREFETVEDKVESEYEHECAFEAMDGWLVATVDLECCNVLCGLTISAGEYMVYDGTTGYCHPLCDPEHALDTAAEARHDRDRERGL